MGLDVGSKTVGVAIADELGFTAQPITTVHVSQAPPSWAPAGLAPEVTLGAAEQGVPMLAATVNNEVRRLTTDELVAFHRESNGQVRLRYAPLLLGMNNPLIPQLLINLVDQLTVQFPSQSRQLTVMRNNLAWKSIVQPVG